MDNFTFGMFGELESYNDREELNEWHDNMDGDMFQVDYDMDDEDYSDYSESREDNYLSGEEQFG